MTRIPFAHLPSIHPGCSGYGQVEFATFRGMSTQWPHFERRREPRFKVQKPCLLLFGESRSTEQCLACDLSASGTRIVCSPAFVFPASAVFLLFIAERLVLPVALKWREGSYVGMMFNGEACHVSDQPALEAEAEYHLPSIPGFRNQDY